jgi:uncharacterized protein (TIGR02271 family)
MQQPQVTTEQLVAMRGAPVYDANGDKIGSVEEIFYDEQTREPEWIGIGTGLFGTKRVLVPTIGATTSDDGLSVRYSKDQVKDSPDIDSDEISQEREYELYEYYGLTPSEHRPGPVLSEDARDYETAQTPAGEAAAVTRSEEELHVGKERVEAGAIRLRKWVETEQVNVPVELRKEKVSVEREPIDREVSAGEIGDEEVEVTVSEEKPVIEKRAVAKERVTVGREVETEHETVGGEVRKERVEVDDSSERKPKR